MACHLAATLSNSVSFSYWNCSRCDSRRCERPQRVSIQLCPMTSNPPRMSVSTGNQTSNRTISPPGAVALASSRHHTEERTSETRRSDAGCVQFRFDERPGSTREYSMRAAVQFEVPGQLEIVDLEVDDPGPREVLIQVAASGLCHS